MSKPVKLEGLKFHWLTAVSRVSPRSRWWNCLCDCGEKTVVATRSLRQGMVRHCGCLGTKWCSKCGQERLVTFFYKAKGFRDGLHSQCKACIHEYDLSQKQIFVVENKFCRKCKNTKPSKDFAENIRSKDGLQGWCRQCRKERNVVNREKNSLQAKKQFAADPDLHRRKHLRVNYGLTIEQRQKMAEDQDNRCAACGTDKPGGNGNTLHVDHDHTTGVVRALLCSRCNITLGKVEEKIEVLQGLIDYLRRHQEKKIAALPEIWNCPETPVAEIEPPALLDPPPLSHTFPINSLGCLPA